jgi:hypothetical protein
MQLRAILSEPKISLDDIKDFYHSLSKDPRVDHARLAYLRFLKNIFFAKERNLPQERNLISQLNSFIKNFGNYFYYDSSNFSDKARVMVQDISSGGSKVIQLLIEEELEPLEFLNILDEIYDQHLRFKTVIKEKKPLDIAKCIQDIKTEYSLSGNLSFALSAYQKAILGEDGELRKHQLLKAKCELYGCHAEKMFREKNHFQSMRLYSEAVAISKNLGETEAYQKFFTDYIVAIEYVAIRFYTEQSFASASYYYQLAIKKILQADFVKDEAQLARLKFRLTVCFNKLGETAVDKKQAIEYFVAAYHSAKDNALSALSSANCVAHVAHNLSNAYQSWSEELESRGEFWRAMHNCDLAFKVALDVPVFANSSLKKSKTLIMDKWIGLAHKLTLKYFQASNLPMTIKIKISVILRLTDPVYKDEDVSKRLNENYIALVNLLGAYRDSFLSESMRDEASQIYEFIKFIVLRYQQQPRECITDLAAAIDQFNLYFKEFGREFLWARILVELRELSENMQLKPTWVLWDDNLSCLQKEKLVSVLPAIENYLAMQTEWGLCEARRRIVDMQFCYPKTLYSRSLEVILKNITAILKLDPEPVDLIKSLENKM